MTDEEEFEVVPHATGAVIGITFFPETPDPVLVITFHVGDEEGAPSTLRVGMSADELESMIPTMLGAVVRARVITEMTTVYPEKRDEILQNLLFRWTDGEGLNG